MGTDDAIYRCWFRLLIGLHLSEVVSMCRVNANQVESLSPARTFQLSTKQLSHQSKKMYIICQVVGLKKLIKYLLVGQRVWQMALTPNQKTLIVKAMSEMLV